MITLKTLLNDSRLIRLLTLAAVVVVVVGSVRLMRPVWKYHGGGIAGDAFTYVSYARLLAKGRFYLDDPVSQLRVSRREAAKAMPGCAWNTSVLPDGRTVYSVGMGYPAFLALMKRCGGTWMMLHANLLLTVLVLVLLFMVIWDGMGRSFRALVAAGAAVLILPRLDPFTFNQFTYPWREPLSYACVLGAAWCLVRFRSKREWSWLLPMGFLLGYACCVKEANVIYVPWLGLVVILTPAFFRQPRVWAWSAAAAAVFLLGVAPILIQNALSTGNPFVSLQAIRETANFSVTEAGAGLSAGNIPNTVHSYSIIYGCLPWFRWPFLLLAVLGMAVSVSSLAGQVLIGILLSHLALYIQWPAGNRHMFFALVPYAFLVGRGAVAFGSLIVRTGRLRLPSAMPAAGGVALLLCLLVLPSPWKRVLDRAPDALRYGNLSRLIGGVERAMGANALLLANRPLRDHWAAYSDRPIVRLHELMGIGSRDDVYDVLAELRLRGHSIFFADNTDTDPRHSGKLDLSLADEAMLRWCHDLVSVPIEAQAGASSAKLTAKPALTLYAVLPWTNHSSSVTLPVPAGGAAFLRVNPQSLGDDMTLTVDGVPVSHRFTEGFYIPATSWDLGEQTVVRLSSRSGRRVPRSPDVRLFGWQDRILQDTAYYANPPDSRTFAVPFPPDANDRGYRILHGPTEIRIPVRNRDDLFTTVRFRVEHFGASDFWFRYQVSGAALPGAPLSSAHPWIPMLPAGTNAGVQSVCILDAPDSRFCLFGFDCHTALSRIEHPVATGTVVVALEGFLAPSALQGTQAVWQCRKEGVVIQSGVGHVNPLFNPFHAYVDVLPGESRVGVEWKGAGLMDGVIADVGSEVRLRLSQPNRALLKEGFHQQEWDGDIAFRWTKASAAVVLPLTETVTRYRLVLNTRDGHPKQRRNVTVALTNGARSGIPQQVPLPADFGDSVLEFQVAEPKRGIATLDLRVDAWCPSNTVGSADDRLLGFQFHSLDWTPLPNEKIARE